MTESIYVIFHENKEGSSSVRLTCVCGKSFTIPIYLRKSKKTMRDIINDHMCKFNNFEDTFDYIDLRTDYYFLKLRKFNVYEITDDDVILIELEYKRVMEYYKEKVNELYPLKEKNELLQEKIQLLEKENEELRTMLYYAPENEGAKDAKKHFEFLTDCLQGSQQ